jgi:hypothetical protein
MHRLVLRAARAGCPPLSATASVPSATAAASAASSSLAASSNHARRSPLLSSSYVTATAAAAAGCSAPAAVAVSSPARLLHTSTSARFSASAAQPATETKREIIVAPAFGTPNHTPYKFMYLKGVKTDGRTKRFYDAVRLEEVETVRGREVAVLLDGRYVVTHYDQLLTCPTTAAALAVAFEFDSQGDFIRPISMPMTHIIVTALDQALVDRERFIKHFQAAMHTDSVLSVTRTRHGSKLQLRSVVCLARA